PEPMPGPASTPTTAAATWANTRSMSMRARDPSTTLARRDHARGGARLAILLMGGRDGLDHAARAQAPGADAEVAVLVADPRPHALQVRPLHPLGLDVGVAHAVAHVSPAPTNLTRCSHVRSLRESRRDLT